MGTKNIAKKILAIVLALTMLIPGVYLGNSGQSDVQAAASVSTDMLNVKVQVAVDGEDVIRFISSVDSLNYSKVGFEITTPSGINPYETKTVYERIVSSETGKQYEFSPKVVDLSSTYFVTAKFKATVGVDYTVRAFVCTLDDANTKIYGPSRTVSLSDAENDIINMMVDFATTEDATYDVYDGDTPIGTAKVIGDKNVRITLTSKTVGDFPSATKLTFQSGTSEVGTAIYRNYYTSYAEDGADTTWYTVDKSATNFVIASSADLYGMAKVINDQMDTTEFANATITLIRNVTVNEDMTKPTYEWTRIGTNAIGFAGTFDGDFNTISGIFDAVAGAGGDGKAHGLFAYVTNSGTLKNFKLDNSKFEFINEDGNTYSNNNAAICGYLQGNLENIYVGTDVTIETNVSAVGGLVGMNSLTDTTQTPNTIKNCWFAGTITGTTGTLGGIIGQAYRGSAILENCLNTGTVEVTGAGVAGGLIGAASGKNAAESGTTLNKNRTTILNSISAGTVKSANTVNAGSVIGYLANTETKIENVYTTDVRECTTEGSSFSTSNSADGLGTWNSNANVTISGLPIVDADGSILNGTGAYTNTEFDFWSSTNEDGIWMAVEGKTPVIKKLSDATGIATLTGTRASEGWYYAAFERPGTKNAAMSRADAATYEIDSVADLNGFSKILNNITNGELFASDTIKLTADIDLNPGWIPQVSSTGVILNAPTHQWDPAGRSYITAEDAASKTSRLTVTNFAGTFDGQGHTISGLYVEAVVRDAGLFGITNETAQIKNFRMSNSYIDSNGKSWCGSVAGVFRGTLLENVYVDESVTLVGSSSIGGITGMSSLNITRKISKCWFAGTLYATSTQVGGILGVSYAGTNTIENCLFTAKIVNTYTGDANTGAMVGDADNATKTIVQDCLAIGEMQVNTTTNTGADVGSYNSSKTEIEDVYSTNNISHATDTTATFTLKTGTIQTTLDEIKADPTTVLSGLLTDSNGEENDAWVLTVGNIPEIAWK